MGRGHDGIPAASDRIIRKSDLLRRLSVVDGDGEKRNRVLDIESKLRTRIAAHLKNLPEKNAALARFNTNPFVLMMVCADRSMSKISELEGVLVPAKEFSSMETSAGRMIEEVVLPCYGWSVVKSGMHSSSSVLDVEKLDADALHVATVKSGPRCLNDEMSKDIADDIVANVNSWATAQSRKKVRFSYAVLYGTFRQSNKKDWHVLRNIEARLAAGELKVAPAKRLNCEFTKGGVDIDVSVRIGLDWWQEVGGDTALVEVLVALIRACVAPTGMDHAGHAYDISDLSSIVSMSAMPAGYNVGLLQLEQIPWLFLLSKHFCDKLVD